MRNRLQLVVAPARLGDEIGRFAACDKYTGQVKTLIQIGENFYGPRDMADALSAQARIPDRPGSGIAWDESAVKRYALDL